MSFTECNFFIKHSIFRKGTFPFTSSISILLVSSFKGSKSLGGRSQGSTGIAAILMKRFNMLLKKRLRNRKKEKRMDPQTACLKLSYNMKP